MHLKQASITAGWQHVIALFLAVSDNQIKSKGNSFETRKGKGGLKKGLSFLVVIKLLSLMFWRNRFCLEGNQNFGNKLKKRGSVVMRYIIFYAGLEPNPWLIL